MSRVKAKKTKTIEYYKENLRKATKQELLLLAKDVSIKDYQKMLKKELVKSLMQKLPSQSQESQQQSFHVRKGDDIVPSPEEINKTKYFVSTQAIPEHIPQEQDGIPGRYGVNRIVLLVRDPYWIHTYWELTHDRIRDVKSSIDQTRRESARLVLRVMDITGSDPDVPNSVFYIHITTGARNWYIHVPRADCAYCVEIGYLLPSGEFFTLGRSNSVHTPRAGMSNIFDERWMSIEDYDLLYVLSGGLGFGSSSLEIVRKKGEILQRESYSGGASQMGMPSSKVDKEFFLKTDTELILYGKTAPESMLYIEGAEKKISPDGTFSIRFQLPEGEHSIPIRAQSKDGKNERTLNIIITKEKK